MSGVCVLEVIGTSSILNVILSAERKREDKKGLVRKRNGGLERKEEDLQQDVLHYSPSTPSVKEISD